MIANKYRFIKITNENDDSETMFNDIQRIWQNRGGTANIINSLKERHFMKKNIMLKLI